MMRFVSVAGTRAVRGFSCLSRAFLFSGKDSTASSTDVVEKFGEAIKSSPALATLLDGLVTSLKSKGITASAPPTPAQLMMLATDSDIRSQLGKVKDALEQSKLNIGFKDIAALAEFYRNSKGSNPQ